MERNRIISFLLVVVMVLSSIFIFPNYTFSEKGEEEIPLIRFLNRNNGFGIFTNSVETDMYNEVEVNDVFLEPGLLSAGDRINIELPNGSRYIAIF